jgi:hypothetical protein
VLFAIAIQQFSPAPWTTITAVACPSLTISIPWLFANELQAVTTENRDIATHLKVTACPYLYGGYAFLIVNTNLNRCHR